MIRSMTAFARHSAQQDWGDIVWELRSVNHRYLEPSFKLPESMRVLEPVLREKLRSQVARGKLECNLKLQMQGTEAAQQLRINADNMAQIINAAETIQAQLREPSAINPLQLLQWPGVLAEASSNIDVIQEQTLAFFQLALEMLIETREREGKLLKQFIEQRLDSIADITSAVKTQMPTILENQRLKLRDKLAELDMELEPERLEQEIVLLVQKADVDEELDRLTTHIAEVRRVLNKGGACGRRLDFLMQELNREANTLSSKSIISDTTQAAVELKVLIEQMREQIQNIE